MTTHYGMDKHDSTYNKYIITQVLLYCCIPYIHPHLISECSSIHILVPLPMVFWHKCSINLRNSYLPPCWQFSNYVAILLSIRIFIPPFALSKCRKSIDTISKGYVALMGTNDARSGIGGLFDIIHQHLFLT